MKYFVKSKLSENIAETPEGFLLCLGVPIARTGEMIYGEEETPLEGDGSGKIIINRDAKQVFRAETIASFQGKPVTIQHPEEFVNPQNWRELTVGIIQNVRQGKGDQKEDLIADLLITDHRGIELVKNGLREVSCGYEADYVQVEEGKGVQENIIGNHLALVEQGRAGSAYAINDHKRKGEGTMKLSDKIKAIFAKAQDEAMKVADEEKKEEPKKEESKDTSAYDELVEVCNALKGAIENLGKGKDEKKEEPKKEEPAKDEEKEEKAKDEEVAPSLEDRLKKLEDAVAKLLGSQAGDEAEESEDADEEESKDDDFEESTMVGDEMSRAEILAPGIETNAKNLKVTALKTAYKTAEGKKVIDSLTGGKPKFDSAENVDSLFISASELLKVSRSKDLANTKKGKTTDSNEDDGGVMTAEKLNEINAKYYGAQK